MKFNILNFSLVAMLTLQAFAQKKSFYDCAQILHYKIENVEKLNDNEIINFVNQKENQYKECLCSCYFENFVTTDLNSKVVDFYSLNKDYYLVNFWYHGCSPCIKEIPVLNRLAEESKKTKNMEFISFSRDSAELLKKYHYDIALKYWRLIPEHHKKADLRGYVWMYPTTFLLNRQYKVLKVWFGPTDDDVFGEIFYREISQYVEKLP